MAMAIGLAMALAAAKAVAMAMDHDSGHEYLHGHDLGDAAMASYGPGHDMPYENV